MFYRLCIVLLWVTSESSAIEGGEHITIKQSPYTVSIIDNTNLVGTGAILTYQSVLTTVIYKKVDSYWVRIGYDNHDNGFNISISSVKRHPDYECNQSHLMIIILLENFKNKEGTFKPIQLPKKDVDPDISYMVSSFGPITSEPHYGPLNAIWRKTDGNCDNYDDFNNSIHTCLNLTGYADERGNPMADKNTLYGISIKMDKPGSTFIRIFPFIHWIVDNQDETTTSTTSSRNTISPTTTTASEDRYVDHGFENRPNLFILLLPIFTCFLKL